jgi:hypothetical protein
MNRRTVVVVIAVLLGLAMGPGALDSAAAAQPPLQWHDLLFIFVAGGVGLFAVLAFQVVVRQYKAFAWGWAAFALIAINVVATGVSAAVTSAITEGVQPHSLMFLVLGVAMAAAIIALSWVFPSRLQGAA